MRRYISKDIAVAVSFILMYMEKETRPSNREISFESETASKTDPKVQFTMDASLTAGSVSVTQSGQSGCIAQLRKIVKVDGKQQSRDSFNKSNYQATCVY